MSADLDADVLVVGAGPVGLTLALHLAHRGVRVTVLEKDDHLGDSPRAMVYLHPLLGDLDAVGLLAPMEQQGLLDHEGFNLHLRSTGEVISIPNTELDGVSPHPYNLHLGQGDFCRIALEVLGGLPGADVRFGADVTTVEERGDSVAVGTSSGETCTAAWVVGADGGHSVVRRAIGATMEGFTWAERFVATNVRWDFRSRGFRSSNMVVDGPASCIVAQISPDGLWRCTYQESLDLPEETAGDRMADHFVRLLGADAAQDVEVVAHRPYRMHQRLASTLRRGRVVLAGDAAHLTNPTGGLGLTTGLYDVLLLQEVLAAIVVDGADEGLLDDYAAERSRVFRDIASPNATAFKKLVYDSDDVDALDAAVQPLREAARTSDSRRRFLEGLDSVRSPAPVHR